MRASSSSWTWPGLYPGKTWGPPERCAPLILSGGFSRTNCGSLDRQRGKAAAGDGCFLSVLGTQRTTTAAHSSCNCPTVRSRLAAITTVVVVFFKQKTAYEI